MTEVATAVAAIRAGGLVVLPTDTVYGLVCTASDEEPARRLYALKRRSRVQPTAIVAATVGAVLDAVPGLPAAAEAVVRALLPGPYTLVVPNPEQRYPWLNAERPDAIGVRVPELPGDAHTVVAGAGPVVATSANLAGGPDPRRLEDVPAEIRAGVAVALDAGELPGTPSTVLDLTGDVPVVLREGAVAAADALARAAGAAGRIQ